MTAYKFFENDPVLFTKSLELTSRCGEDQYHCLKNTTSRYLQGAPASCTITGEGRKMCYPGRNAQAARTELAQTVVTTYTWIYEWE